MIDQSPCLTKTDVHAVCQWWDGKDVAHTLTKCSHNQYMPDKGNFEAIITRAAPFDLQQITCKTNKSTVNFGSEAPTMAKHSAMHAIIQSSTIDCRNLVENKDISGTLQSKKTGGYSLNYTNPIFQKVISCHPPHCFKIRGGCEGGGKGYLGSDDMAFTLSTSHDQDVFIPPAVIRRLTPTECERLQGFPDGCTDIPGAKDSNRYAALGNSMTTNVMRWIGERIDAVDKLKYIENNLSEEDLKLL